MSRKVRAGWSGLPIDRHRLPRSCESCLAGDREAREIQEDAWENVM